MTKQFEIQDGDFYFLADAHKSLGLVKVRKTREEEEKEEMQLPLANNAL